jgi:hypothetical protein
MSCDLNIPAIRVARFAQSEQDDHVLGLVIVLSESSCSFFVVRRGRDSLPIAKRAFPAS